MHDWFAIVLGALALALSVFNTWWAYRSPWSFRRLWEKRKPDTAPLGFGRRPAR